MQTIANNIFYCGSQDADRKLFDQLVPLPQGTTYNSYLIFGSEKTVLIDTVYPKKVDELIKTLDENNVKKIDYIVANHGEQDHSGSLPAILEKYPDAIVVTNQKCKEIIQDMLHINEEKFKVIQDNEELSLGDKTLKFILAPWVHWPDTMFTYVVEDKLLFTTDFLGAHYPSTEIFADNSNGLYDAAKRYYAEIMMPFRSFCTKYVQKIKEMDVSMILPAHGPIYKDPSFILNAYEEWTTDIPKNQVTIPYVSMYGSTEEMVNHLKNALENRGIKVECFDLIDGDIGELAMSLVDSATVVVGSSMVLAGPHPSIVYGTYLINALRPKTKFLSIIGSYGWGGNMIGKCAEIMNLMKVERLADVVIKGKPKEDDFKKLDNLADLIAEKHKQII